MKFNKSFLLAPLMVVSLASCAMIAHHYKESEYFLKYVYAKNDQPLDSDGDFNILQLSDIHMGIMDDARVHYKFIKKTIDTAKGILEAQGRSLHLIAISGDVFTFANKDTVKELCGFFEEQKVPWTLTFGNHDEQGYFSIDWLTSYLTNLSKNEDTNLLFCDLLNDDVFGSANFVIDLPVYLKQNRQIIMIDSNRYNYGEGYGYDYIHYDQIDWYRRMYEYARSQRVDEDVSPHSLAFFHIPVPEFTIAYEDAKSGKSNSVFLKSILYKEGEEPKEVIRDVHNDSSDGAPKVNSGFYETVQNYEYTKGLFVGHAHTNTNCTDYCPNDYAETAFKVALCYGVKATDRIYCDEEMMGGQLIHYHAYTADGEDITKGSSWFDLDLIYHRYADLKEGK